MFTGIIEELGTVRSVRRRGDGVDLVIAAKKVTRSLREDNSIAVNGVCLTVEERTAGSFKVHAVKETLSKTSLSALTNGSLVNLERSVRLQDRLGGHLVQGHVDTVGIVKNVVHLATSWMLTIAYPSTFRKYLIPVGSVSVDGTSLTVARIGKGTLTIAIIPYTFDHTVVQTYRKGTRVNLEFDIIGKYLESFVHYHP